MRLSVQLDISNNGYIYGSAAGKFRQAAVETHGNRYGFDIIEATGLAGGTVYPTLGRLEKRGYLRARWEDRQLATREGRPRRRYYTVTKQGERALKEAGRRFRQLGDELASDGSLAHGRYD